MKRSLATLGFAAVAILVPGLAPGGTEPVLTPEAVEATVLTALICPSDPGGLLHGYGGGYGIQSGQTTYRGVKTNYDFSAQKAYSFNYWQRQTIQTRYMFGENSTAQVASVRDGLSNTVAMAETLHDVANGPCPAWGYRGWYMTGIQLGLSKFVSLGNRCDVDVADILEYLKEDERTKVVLMYIEGVRDGRRFMEVAKEVTRKKPVVALKSGRTRAGARAAKSHTGSIAGVDEVYDAAFSQCGIIRAQNMEQFFDIGKTLAMQPPAKGPNIAVITDAGGPGIMAVDECEMRGLVVPEFSEGTKAKLRKLVEEDKIPPFAAIGNPIDLTGSATADMFEEALKIALEDPDIHGVIIMGLHHVPALSEEYVDKVVAIAKQYEKPVVACDIGETEMAIYIRRKFDKYGIPACESPEDAATVMAALVTYGQYLMKIGVLK